MNKVKLLMEKIVLKEYKKPIYAIDAILYALFVVLGFILLNFSEIGLNDPTKYAPYIFYMLAFFALLAYFSNRREGDYELLFFGLINVVVATFTLINMYTLESRFMMADAVLIYSIAVVINKGYSCHKLLKEKNINFFAKISVTILLLILGVFIVSSLYNKIEVGILILGYFFIIFGLLSLLEPLMAILSQNKSFERYAFDILSYDEKEVEEVKEEKEEKKKEEKEKKEEKKTTKTTRKTTKKSASKKTTTSKTKKPIKNRTIKKIKKK